MSVTKVVFQGERGAYGEIAAIQYFPTAKLMPLKSFQDVFISAEKGDADYAIVPVENSIEGSVNEIYDLLLETKMNAIGEVYQRVKHCLIANKNSDKIKFAYSHPQALAQCRGYLQRYGIEAMPAYDTAGAVKMIKEKEMFDSAAIASRRAADLYDMQIIEEGIEDRKNNYTRFLILSLIDIKMEIEKDAKYKTSIIFSLRHIPGALFEILNEFASRRINLTKIESRPTKETPWEYNFYVDVEGNLLDKDLSSALESIRSKSSYIKILGSYKRAEFH
jgi:prephenate dehydratase